ncbi:MAG: hypothetical protein S4CHLAM123_01640 [Chlamydiales bacterium]|nr:hypothetical protein [Chlamydiales bacterium]
MFGTASTTVQSSLDDIQNNQQTENLTESSMKGRSVSKWSCNPCLTAIKWIAVATLVAGVIVGAAGLLVHLGLIQFAIANIGFMSSSTGLFTAIAGLGTAVILTTLLSIKCCLDKAHDKRNAIPLGSNPENKETTQS